MRRRLVVAAVIVSAVLAATLSAAYASSRTTQREHTASPLTVWYQTASPSYDAHLRAVGRRFLAKYHVQVKWIPKSFNSIVASAKLALSGPGSPDIIQTYSGWPFATLVKDKLLANLDSYARKYHWTKRFQSSILAPIRVKPDGLHYGVGDIYGLGDIIDYVGWYYNKALLAKIHARVPATFNQLTADLAKAKQQGITPIVFGDSDLWPAQHVYYSLLPRFVSQSTIRNWVYGNRGASINVPGAVKAAQIFQSWATTDGYLMPGFLGLSSDQALAKFLHGAGLFFPLDSFYTEQIAESHDNGKFGFFLLPPLRAGGAPVTTGAITGPFDVAARSKNIPMAAALVNMLTDRRSEKQVVKNVHNLPAQRYSYYKFALPKAGALGDSYRAYKDITNRGAFVPWMDWASPSMYTQLAQNLQSLIGGKMSPAALLQATQANQASYLKSIRH